MKTKIKLFAAAVFLLTLAACSSMKQIWDLKGIIVSSNNQIFTGKSTTVPMDIKSGNLRYEFTATSDPVDNGYPVSIKVDDSSVASVTQSTSNPSSYTITGLKSGYTAVTASCSTYSFTFIVYVADTSRGITVDKLKQQREDDLAKLKAEEEAKKAAEALAKQQAAEKAAADKAAADAAAKKSAEEAAKKAAAEAAAATFAPKAGDVYALDESGQKYIYFPTADEMHMTYPTTFASNGIGTQYKVKYTASKSKSENGWYFKTVDGTTYAYYNHSSGDAEVYPAENFDRSIYPEGSDPWDWADDPKTTSRSLYNTWHVFYRSSEGGNFPRFYTMKFTSSGNVTFQGPRYVIGDEQVVNYDNIDYIRETLTKTYSYTKKDGIITIKNGGALYYDGKQLLDAFVVKKVTDSAKIQKVKNARWFQPSDEK